MKWLKGKRPLMVTLEIELRAVLPWLLRTPKKLLFPKE
jgi:hypothetical protein